jgi:hypothetical protein
MKFLQTVDYVLEVTDDMLLEYVDYCKQYNKQYLASDFMEWLENNYYLSDLVGDERVSDDLTTNYLIDEINYVLDNDRERIS